MSTTAYLDSAHTHLCDATDDLRRALQTASVVESIIILDVLAAVTASRQRVSGLLSAREQDRKSLKKDS